MKSKTEIKLDKEFEKIGVKPRIYYFVGMYPFGTVTVATDNPEHTWKDIMTYIGNGIGGGIVNEFGRATRLLHTLQDSYCLYGVAICNIRDQFNRKQGRIIAKGRLLKSLKRND